MTFIKKAKSAFRIFRDGGVKAVIRKIRDIRDRNKKTVCDYNFVIDSEKVVFDEEAYSQLDSGKKIVLNWVIPLPGIGSGGHTTIFRFVCFLQSMGFHNRVYTMNGDDMAPDKEFHDFVERYYGVTDKTLELHHGISRMQCAHATIATSWETAYVVKNFDNTISKFYFVQDFEPYFFPVGSRYCFAENTYKFGFRGITAGYWLQDKLRAEYGMETEGFGFSYDRKYYKKNQKKDNKNRILYYARPYTERRSFEMGMVVLNALSQRISDLEIVIIGASLEDYQIPFPYVNPGIVPIEKLSNLYAQCDMCLVLSHTNLSLLPLEVMASNSVAVCNKGANSEWLVNADNVILTENEPLDIIEKIIYYFEHREELAYIREKGMAFANETSWEAGAKKVAAFIKKGVKQDEEKQIAE